MRNRLLNSHKTHHHSNRRRQRHRQQQIRQQMDRHRKLSAIVSVEIEVIAAVACETKSQWPQQATVSPARSSSMEVLRKQWKFCRFTRNKATKTRFDNIQKGWKILFILILLKRARLIKSKFLEKKLLTWHWCPTLYGQRRKEEEKIHYIEFIVTDAVYIYDYKKKYNLPPIASRFHLFPYSLLFFAPPSRFVVKKVKKPWNDKR